MACDIKLVMIIGHFLSIFVIAKKGVRLLRENLEDLGVEKVNHKTLVGLWPMVTVDIGKFKT